MSDVTTFSNSAASDTPSTYDSKPMPRIGRNTTSTASSSDAYRPKNDSLSSARHSPLPSEPDKTSLYDSPLTSIFTAIASLSPLQWFRQKMSSTGSDATPLKPRPKSVSFADPIDSFAPDRSRSPSPTDRSISPEEYASKLASALIAKNVASSRSRREKPMSLREGIIQAQGRVDSALRKLWLAQSREGFKVDMSAATATITGAGTVLTALADVCEGKDDSEDERKARVEARANSVANAVRPETSWDQEEFAKIGDVITDSPPERGTIFGAEMR